MALKEYKPGIGSGVSDGRAPPLADHFALRAAVRIHWDDPLGDGGYFGQLLHDTEEEEKAFARRNGEAVSDDNSFASNIFVNQARRNLVREGVS